MGNAARATRLLVGTLGIELSWALRWVLGGPRRALRHAERTIASRASASSLSPLQAIDLERAHACSARAALHLEQPERFEECVVALVADDRLPVDGRFAYLMAALDARRWPQVVESLIERALESPPSSVLDEEQLDDLIRQARERAGTGRMR